MKKEDFAFLVPPELIAIEPANPRSSSKLLVYSRDKQRIHHSHFRDLAEFLKPTDLLVFNSTRVLPARFFAKKESGGEIEGLWLKASSAGVSVWLKGRCQGGDFLNIEGFGKVRILSRTDKDAELECDSKAFYSYLQKSGTLPLPPYIVAERRRRKFAEKFVEDPESYQSIFAKMENAFSAAAPTASLHIDENLFSNLKARGIEAVDISLHIGVGTFAPLQSLDQTHLHEEEVLISRENWQKILEAKSVGRRIVGIGTTVLRSLESRARLTSELENFSTDLFVKPPFRFEILNALITNFHWPDSSLIVLVAAFCEPEKENIDHHWKNIYDEAVREKYRFFSYGDGMLIL